MPNPTDQEYSQANAALTRRLKDVLNHYNSIKSHDLGLTSTHAPKIVALVDLPKDIKTSDPKTKFNFIISSIENALQTYMDKKKQTPAQFEKMCNDTVKADIADPAHHYPRLIAITLRDAYKVFPDLLDSDKPHLKTVVANIRTPRSYEDMRSLEKLPPAAASLYAIKERVGEMLKNYSSSNEKGILLARLDDKFQEIIDNPKIDDDQKLKQMVGILEKVFDKNMNDSSVKLFSKNKTPEQLIEKLNTNMQDFGAGKAKLDFNYKRMIAITLKDIYQDYKSQLDQTPETQKRQRLVAIVNDGGGAYKFKPLDPSKPAKDVQPTNDVDSIPNFKVHR
jgi:hypothetical protein